MTQLYNTYLFSAIIQIKKGVITVKKQEENKPVYYCIPNTTLKLDECDSIRYYEFPTHIESTASTYTRHFRTKSEIQNELNYWKKRQIYALNEEQEKEIAEKITELEKELQGRKQTHKPRKKTATTRITNIASLERSKKRLVHLLYNNFAVPFALHITLTYAKKEYLYSNLCKDFTRFRKKLCYRFKKVAFIAIYEPHEDSSWHIHLILKNCKGVNRKLLEDLWQKGRVDLKKFDVLNSPYFCKSERLEDYPVNARLYSKSKNIVPPVEQKADIPSFKRKVSGMNCVSQEGKRLVVEENGKKRVVNNFLFQKYSKGNYRKKQD